MSEKKATILVVDDNEVNTDILVRRLEKFEHKVISVSNGQAAMDILYAEKVDLVLLDIVMPDISGYEVLDRIKRDERLAPIPVIMISALDKMTSVVRCIESGADDYLTKPFSPVLLHARVNSCLTKKIAEDKEKLYRKHLREYALEIEESANEKIDKATKRSTAHYIFLAKLAEQKDKYLGLHLQRVRAYCDALVKKMSTMSEFRNKIDREFIENLYATSSLHDIGNSLIPDCIILKEGKFESHERELMKKHTRLGMGLVEEMKNSGSNSGFVDMAIDITGGHHEKWNGSGYPHELAANAIPLSARIVAVADVYDALVSRRNYKNPYSREESTEIIKSGRGVEFDPGIVDAFMQIEATMWTIKTDYQDDIDEDYLENIA